MAGRLFWPSMLCRIFLSGINDPLGGNPKNIPFTATIFTLFDKLAAHGRAGHSISLERNALDVKVSPEVEVVLIRSRLILLELPDSTMI